MTEKRWKELGIKDKIQYIMAIVLIASGIILAFLSFFLNSYNIATGVLIYISQCFITAGGIFGVSIYFKNKLGEFQSDAKNQINELIKQITDKIDNSSK